MQFYLRAAVCRYYVRDSILATRKEKTFTPELEAFATHLSEALVAGTSRYHGVFNARVAEEHYNGVLYYTDVDHFNLHPRYTQVEKPIEKTYRDYEKIFLKLYRHSNTEDEYSKWMAATLRGQIQIGGIYFVGLLTLIEVFFDSNYAAHILRGDADLERSFIADMLIAITLATLAAARFRDDNKHSYLAALQTLWRHAHLDTDVEFTSEQFEQWQTQSSPIYGSDQLWYSACSHSVDPTIYEPEKILKILEHHQLIERVDNGWRAVHLLYLENICNKVFS